ncbi:MAG: hypothetical protein NWE83_04655 [Candidatus Bathyarchaeota archaeon]|nr:hypothetical protein [Candidatus Bathyarchaeota archaeon]
MTMILLPIIAFGAILALILSFRLEPNQSITCPHCHLEFTKDLYTVYDHTLVACRFCHRWMHIRKIRNAHFTDKIW